MCAKCCVVMLRNCGTLLSHNTNVVCGGDNIHKMLQLSQMESFDYNNSCVVTVVKFVGVVFPIQNAHQGS